jgi:VWFA-related protein
MFRVPPSIRAAALAFCVRLLAAQAPETEVAIRTHAYTPPAAVLHAESNLVETQLAVRDPIGRTVAGLRASDFEVLDNGVPQQIAAFSELRRDVETGMTPEAPREPRYVIFLFDDLHLGRFDLPFVKQAARKFIANGLKPWDRMSIETSSGSARLDFTSDSQQFAQSLERLNLHTHVYNSIEEYEADSGNLLSAVAAAARRLSFMQGERILVLLSSGFIIHISNEHDVESQIQKVIDAALRYNVLVHAIDGKGLSTSPTLALNRPLRELSNGAGGHFFENTNDLAGAMRQAAEPEVSYQIAFNPGQPDGKFHKLKIRYKSKGAEAAEFRPGYFAHTDTSEKALAARVPMDDAVLSGQSLHDVPFTVALAGGQPQDGAVPVSIGVTVDLNRLQFASWHGRHVQQIVLILALLDTSGAFVTGKESIMELALTDEKLASLKKTGLKTVATLTAPPGRYQVRTVVREGMTGALSASTQAIRLLPQPDQHSGVGRWTNYDAAKANPYPLPIHWC